MPDTPDRLGQGCKFYLVGPDYCEMKGFCAALDTIKNQKEAGGLSQAEEARMEASVSDAAIKDGCTEIHPEPDAPEA